jgi:U3 small nucleolar RNA-associated protein 10
MSSSLAAQLRQIAANSKTSLNVKAQKAAHSKSLIFEPRDAASQSFQSLYTICHDGFEDLCQLDARFIQFGDTLFSKQSQNEDRTQMTAEENAELDKKIDAFLRLAGARLRLMPTIKSIEWLVRRFRYVCLLNDLPNCLTFCQNPRLQRQDPTPNFPPIPLDTSLRDSPINTSASDSGRI